MSVVTERGVIVGMSESEYHQHPALSSSGAKQLLRSPAHYQHSLTNKVVKDEFDIGSAVHLQVLGAGWPVDVHDFDSWRTKAAQEARDESRANGRIPVLEKDYAPVVAMAAATLNHPIARALFEREGQPEVSCFTDDVATGVPLRARIDWLPDRAEGRTLAVDLKTARSADPRSFARAAAEYGYAIQSAWYQQVLRDARGDTDTAFLFVVVESAAPYLVSVIELTGEFPQIGRQQMRRAIDLYAKCRANDDWPGYPTEIQYVEPPLWAVRQAEDEEYAA